MCQSCWKIGRKRSIESVEKQNKTRILKYGDNIPGSFKKGQKSWNQGKHVGDGKDHRIHVPKGKTHGMYIDGRTSLRHKLLYMPEYKKWRKFIFERDKYTCQNCYAKSSKDNPIYLEAHHVKPVIILREHNINTIDRARTCKELWDTNNGITLCEKCHDPLKLHPIGRDNKGRLTRILQ